MIQGEDNWYERAFAFLGGVPDDYLVFDTETNGLNPESPSTLPLELGYALVQGRRATNWASVLIDWTKGPDPVDPGWFFRSVEQTAEAMHSRGKAYHLTPRRLIDEGVSPREAFDAFLDLLRVNADGGAPLVAHNGFGYDRVLIEASARRLGRLIEIDPETLIDTGLLEKCLGLGWTPPLPGSALRKNWYDEIRGKRATVRWSLDVHCEQKYNLSARHGQDVSAAHSAGFDSLVTHHLLEAYRELASGDSRTAA